MLPFALLLLAAGTPAAPPFDRALLGAFKPLPAQFDSEQNPITADKVELGRLLFHDPRLSKNHDVSCASCHDLGAYGVDGKPTSTGHRGQKGTRNAPSVYNAGAVLAQFWVGRAATL